MNTNFYLKQPEEQQNFKFSERFSTKVALTSASLPNIRVASKHSMIEVDFIVCGTKAVASMCAAFITSQITCVHYILLAPACSVITAATVSVCKDMTTLD